jgi:uncharacterized protein YnzC (UPF0291/DUF896 family)
MPGFKPAKKPIAKAPVELLGPVKSSEIEAATSTGKIRGMFESATPVVIVSKRLTKKDRLDKANKISKLAKLAKEEELEEREEGEEADELKQHIDVVKKPLKEKIDSEDLLELKSLIEMETNGLDADGDDKFYEPIPKAYIPSTSRGFSEFIKETYKSFILDPSKPPLPGEEKYPYQRFIREYMRNDSPYRGILTYHGLGSGKTCTAIAAAEAIYSRGKKKIIVMTPFSLRKNFLKEVSQCGFRHFRLKNFWTSMPVGDADARLFATSVLNIPELHLKSAKSIWIPDFRQVKPNYNELSADEQTEIRKQILSILVWDAKKNPTGLIRFINYNGISAKKLKEIACKAGGADFFNDSVIVIDEIHNVVRLMQGTIDPYLLGLPGAKRIIAKEEVTVETWKPSLCANPGKNYMRGYLFYRLLLDAKNSKIIGLSGTPIINFPEEVGILMNILHGYIPTLEFILQDVGDAAQKAIKAVFMKNLYIDFVSVVNDATGRGSKVTLTLMPHGVRKTDELVGVERIDPEESVPSVDEIIDAIKEDLLAAKFTLSGEITVKALPLLPPFGEEFRKDFLKGDEINNNIVLIKRLTGLISYYKGSRADLMPRIKSDVVVRVPMSIFSQKGYVAARNEEISKEKTKKGAAAGPGGAWAEVYEIGTGAQTSNYKMASRQACNFVFPSDVIRPKPKNLRESRAEADSGNKLADIIEREIDIKKEEDFPEMDEDGEEDDDAGAVADEDEAIRQELVEGPPPVEGQVGGADEDNAIVEPTAQAPDVAADAIPAVPAVAAVAAVEPVKKKFIFKKAQPSAGELEAAMKTKALAQKAECKSGVNEPYRDATVRAKECLATIGKYSLKLGGENGLETHSPKFAKMLENIHAAPGSSLVYSQFLDMEGIGIFRLAMNANGYAPIEIAVGPAGPEFTKDTKMSLSKGPAGQSRYMTFSGGEDEDIRRLYLDIFNANFNDLPEGIKSVLQTNGFINNHKGEIARVFCITSAGAEGLSLKCVRAVHIMEPYWNDVRLKQVKGRAIRIGSHLELPESERDVTIYTYLSCFSQEAQVEKAGDKRIDETIRQSDAIDRESALKLNLPIPKLAAQYVFTTDERIYEIAERKKTITNALENVMKSSAVDCELFSKENKDGTFQCLSLKGAVGDFMYHPDINIDIRESASQFAVSAKPVAKAPLAKAPAPKDYIRKKLGKADDAPIYRLKKVLEDGALVRFDIYEDVDGGKLVGTAGVKGDNPGPPIKMDKTV